MGGRGCPLDCWPTDRAGKHNRERGHGDDRNGEPRASPSRTAVRLRDQRIYRNWKVLNLRCHGNQYG